MEISTCETADIIARMTTSIEISGALLDRVRATAAREGVTVRSLVEEGLREVLIRREVRHARFQLRDASFHGNGLQPGIDPTNWRIVATEIDGGRGGRSP